VNELGAALADHIAAHGPVGFDDFVAQALYAPGGGFYTAGHGAGRRRDFLTSPEVGPLFGAVVARALDTWWDELGRPDPFVVVEIGAGPGTLARTILASAPACSGVLDLVLVEVGSAQWATHPAEVRSRADLPAPGELGPGPVVVLANELFDNVPFGLVERTAAGWAEVLVGVTVDGRFAEVLAPLDPARAAWCAARVADVAVGARLPVQAESAALLVELLALADGGRVVAIDYASTSSAMARRPWTDWVRTYAAHGRAGSPLDDPGSRDITCEVAVDQLALVRPPGADRTQADFLAAHGIAELVEAGRARWLAEGIGGGLPAIAGQSRVSEAAALLDPDGLGAFRVLEWLP